jgi:competence protein ComEC
VSVGLGNPYGHPSPVTLDRLAAMGVPTARTDLDGDIAVLGPVDDLRLVSSRG